MLLKSISIEHFQQYDKPFELKGLSAGLNVLYGNNEAGKSTLLRALRAILFDRFNGKGAEDYASYKGGCPEIKIEFEVNGNNYTLEKVFSKKKEGRAFLTDEQGRQWIGTEAEIHVAELLKFDIVERGIAKSEQQGICGVLWVEQGNAWQQVSVSNNTKATQTIQSVLNHELTDMLSQGKGESLLIMFSNELNEYQTEKNGKPKGIYKEKLEKKEAAKQKLETVQEELKNYQNKVDLLSSRQQNLAELIDDRVEENDKELLQKALAHLKQAEDIKQQHAKIGQDLELCELKRKNAENALHERLNLIETLRAETEKQKLTQIQIQELETEVKQLEKNLNIAQDALSNAKIKHDQSQSALRKTRDYQKLTTIKSNSFKNQEQLKKLQALNEDIQNKRFSLSQILLDSSILIELRKANEQVQLLQAKFDAVATRIEYAIKDDLVKLNDKPFVGQGEIFISDKSALTFGNSQIFITPGGEEVSSVQKKLEDAGKQLATQFKQYNVASLVEAQEQSDAKSDLSKEIKLLKAQMELIAPNGIESLEHELIENQIEEQKLIKQIGDYEPLSIDNAELHENATSKELANCNENERQLHDRLIKKQETLKHAKTILSSSRDSLESLTKKLENARSDSTDEQLRNVNNKIADEKLQIKEKLQQLKNTLQSLDYEGAASDVERRQQVLNVTQNTISGLKQMVRDLTIELQTSGHRGFSEEKEQAQQALKDISTEVEWLEMHVGSLNLLCQLIKENIQSAKEMLVKPLTEAMTPYLKILFPDSEPILDEEFCLPYILRGGIREPFENLSIGTREQLAILLRLAYADLLANKGIPVPIILDDALVNSDDERREKMKQILHRASKKYQIILLTCHGADYRDSGGTLHSL